VPPQLFQEQWRCSADRQKGAHKAVLKSGSIRRFLSYAIALVGHFQSLSASGQNRRTRGHFPVKP